MQTDWLEDMVCSRIGGIEIGRMRSIARVIRMAWRYGHEELERKNIAYYISEVLCACGCSREESKKWSKDFTEALEEDMNLNG